MTLAGKAAIAVHETLTFEDQEKDKIEPLVAKFETYCLPKKNVTQERHLLNLRKQKPDESVEEFLTELKRLAKNCKYGELTNSIIKARIVEGINNDYTRVRLFREKDLSLERYIDICKAAEVANKHMKTLTDQSSKSESVNAVSEGRNYRSETHSGLRGNGGNFNRDPRFNSDRSNCSRCGRGNHGYDKCPAVEKECRKYHKKNHFMNQCKSRGTVYRIPFGRYKYVRLPFGISSAPEIYHRTINSLFSHLEGVDTSMDDIIIYELIPQKHDQGLEAAMKVGKEVGLKLQKEKCKVSVLQLPYMGDTISAEGLKPDQKKIEAIQNMERP